jgi:hypothetical protein
MVEGPDARFISNRIFNDGGQNIFSEHQLSQWVWVWGQFLDHTFGLRQEKNDETINIPFDADDPLESFTNDLGVLPFTPDRGRARHGEEETFASSEHAETRSSTRRASTARLRKRQDWLREGSLDGDPTNNKATFLLPDGQLPNRGARDDVAGAPEMAIDGGCWRIRPTRRRRRRARQPRTSPDATQTLFAREHNRIVGLLPKSSTEEQKLPGRAEDRHRRAAVDHVPRIPARAERSGCPRYRGYNANVNATLGERVRTVGYRAHSQIHGEFEVETEAARYSDEQLDGFEAQGIEVEPGEDDVRSRCASR